MKHLKKKPIFISSLKTQLVTVLIIMSIVPMVSAGIFTYLSTKENMGVEKRNTLKAYSRVILESIESKMEVADNSLRGMANNADLISTLTDFNLFSKTDNTIRYYSIQMALSGVVKNSQKLYSTVLVYDINGKAVMYGSKQSESKIGTDFYSPEAFEYLKRHNTFLIGNPITEGEKGKILIPVSRPISSAKGFIGVITIMFDHKELTEGYDKFNFAATGAVLVINKDNRILFHNDSKLINSQNKSVDLKNILKEETESAFRTYNFAGKENMLFFQKSGRTGWLICTQVQNSEFYKSVNDFKSFIIIVILLLIVLATVISLVFSSYISRPVTKLTAMMKSISTGDLRVAADFKTTVREMEELKQGFASMIENLKRLIKDIVDASGYIGGTTAYMTAASQNSLEHAGDTLNAVIDITGCIQEQAAGTEVAAKNVEELAEKIGISIRLSNEAGESSKRVNDAAENGLKLVDILRIKSDENIRNTQMVDNVIQLLSEEITEINKIAKTITNIAKQTNLLALNASIEAARAGDAGKGFSVVAGEIQLLSEQTKSEAGEINKLIFSIQKKSEELVTTMKDANNAADKQNEAVLDTQAAFGSIYKSIKEVIAKTVKISKHLDEMSIQKTGIVGLVRNLNEIAEEIAASSESVQQFTENQIKIVKDVHSYADNLNELVDRLQKSIKHFSL
ncbi:MAG: methyl-accepting chemotaxis protein [Clostridia bacterium]|nr:methyl-accepting chemotaxis protein [Clostridia bacterium]